MSIKRKTLAKIRRGETEPAFHAEAHILTPRFAQQTKSDRIMDGWSDRKIEDVMKKNRQLAEGESSWVGEWCRLRRLFFDDDLRFPGTKQGKWLATVRGKRVGAMLEKLNADLWTEFLLQDNAVVFWMAPEEGKLPRPIVLDSECCEYTNGLGGETLKLKFEQKALTDAEKKGMSDRWLEAYKKGFIVLDPSLGEHFAVITRAKEGKGLGMPRLRQAYRLLGNLEGLQIADSNGALWHQDVIQHITAGHEIRNGEKAGHPDHFPDAKLIKAIYTTLQKMKGAYRNVSRFDVEIAYKYLDPKFFEAAKYDGTLRQLDRWGGAAMLLLVTAQASPFLLMAFGAEGRHERGIVGGLIAELCSRPEFLPDGPKDAIKAAWNPHTFRDAKMLAEAVRMALGEGLCSRQTGRDILEFDHEQEGDRLEDEAKPNKQIRNRPGFEPKQGMLTPGAEGGRPQSKPGDGPAEG